MKTILQGLALIACLILFGCADSSTVGTCIEKEYNITLNVQDNTEQVSVSIPVTVEADSVTEADQTTADTATATPSTTIQPIPLR